MEYGQIAGNRSINTMIYRCFSHVHKGDVPKFVKKFREQVSDNTQVMHTFRELILGAYLASRGFNVRYEHPIDGEKPDWCVLDQSSALTAVVELTNFHLDRVTEHNVELQLQRAGYWVGWQEPNDSRLYQSMWYKAGIYKSLILKYSIPYILALFGEFTAAVNEDELHECLYNVEHGLFEQYREVSGVLFFDESGGRYQFTYMANPNASKNLSIPSGSFDCRSSCD